jgi:hypothetical protein
MILLVSRDFVDIVEWTNWVKKEHMKVECRKCENEFMGSEFSEHWTRRKDI